MQKILPIFDLHTVCHTNISTVGSMFSAWNIFVLTLFLFEKEIIQKKNFWQLLRHIINMECMKTVFEKCCLDSQKYFFNIQCFLSRISY